MTSPPAIDRPTVVVDCDPGHDDVIALAVAAAHCDLLGITTVAGNAPLDQCTRNALATTQILGIDAPVFAGADRPLVREPRHATAVHGDTGLGGVAVPEPTTVVGDTTAVEFILETARAHEGLWLVPTGPLTNIAMAFRADPAFSRRLAGVSLMGGAVAGGNVTPAAEFNLWFDPDAAAIVFASGVPIRMCGLDVTQQVLVGHGFAEDIRAIGGAGAEFLADVFDGYADSCEALTGTPAGALHDPCAVVALTHPDVFEFEHLHVEVERRGVAAGMTVADRRGYARVVAGTPNVHAALGVDADRMRAIMRDAIATVAGEA